MNQTKLPGPWLAGCLLLAAWVGMMLVKDPDEWDNF
jgi:hypothetical protein